VIVLSGCIGCVTANADGKTPDPAEAVSDAVAVHRINAFAVAFEGPYDQAEAGYQDNGLVIITRSSRGISGYVRIDLWLPPTQHALATAILNSFRVS
jgi:hypothetical protein